MSCNMWARSRLRSPEAYLWAKKRWITDFGHPKGHGKLGLSELLSLFSALFGADGPEIPAGIHAISHARSLFAGSGRPKFRRTMKATWGDKEVVKFAEKHRLDESAVMDLKKMFDSVVTKSRRHFKGSKVRGWRGEGLGNATGECLEIAGLSHVEARNGSNPLISGPLGLVLAGA